MKPKDIRRIGRGNAHLLPHVTGGTKTGSHKPTQAPSPMPPVQPASPKRNKGPDHDFELDPTPERTPTPAEGQELKERLLKQIRSCGRE